MLNAFFRDSAIYSFASLISKVFSVFLLPIYTHVLSPNEFGAYDLLMTFGALANIIIALEISQGLARSLADTSDAKERSILASTSLYFTIFMYLLFFLCSLLASEEINSFILGDEKYLDSFRYFIFFISVNGIYTLVINQFRWELRSKDYALMSILTVFLTLFLSIIFCLFFDLGLIGVISAQISSLLIVSIFSFILLRDFFLWRFDSGKLIEMLSFSAPLVPAGLAVFISLYISRIALNHYGSLNEVGIFGVSSRIAAYAGFLIIGIRVALTPLIYKNYHDPNTNIKLSKLFSWFLVVALIGCSFLNIFSRDLLMIIATPEYVDAYKTIGILAIALIISQMYIFSPGIALAKKTLWQLSVSIMGAGVSILLNFLLVPNFGVLGAALSNFISSIAFLSFWIFLSQRLYRIPYQWKLIFIASLIFIVHFLINAFIDSVEMNFYVQKICKLILFLTHSFFIFICGLLSFEDRKIFFKLIKNFIGK